MDKPVRLDGLKASEEILGFAQDFAIAVIKGDVSSREGQGGGYALTSRLRTGYHVGTSAAPIELVTRSTNLIDALEAGGNSEQAPQILRNLEAACSSLSSAYKNATSDECQLNQLSRKFVTENLEGSLPEMQRVIEKVRKMAQQPS